MSKKGIDHHLAMYANSHMSKAGALLLCKKLSITYDGDPSENNFTNWSSTLVSQLKLEKGLSDKQTSEIIIKNLPLMANPLLFMDADSACSSFISGVNNDIQKESQKRIKALLCTLFNHESVESFLTENNLCSESLPPRSRNTDDYFFGITNILLQHGAINSRFFSLLARERPLQEKNIVIAADYFGVPSEDVTPRSPIDSNELYTATRDYGSTNTFQDNHLAKHCLTREQLTSQLTPGVVINDRRYQFRLQERIYFGQFSEVWTATDLNSQPPGKLVVLKIISVVQSSAAGYAVHLWVRSIRAIKILQGVSGVIRPLTGVELWQGVVFYALPYYSRGTLYEAVINRSADTYALLGGLIGIVKALSIAHQKLILHRDISPRNILLNDRLDMVLTDWDNCAMSARELHSSNDSFLGTEGFAAPETHPDHNAPPDARSDIFSMAQIMIFCFLGTFPTAGSRRTSLEASCYNPQLIDVLCKASSSVADHRHASMAEFHAALVGAFQFNAPPTPANSIQSLDHPADNQREHTLPPPAREHQELEQNSSPQNNMLYSTIYWTIAIVMFFLLFSFLLVFRMIFW